MNPCSLCNRECIVYDDINTVLCYCGKVICYDCNKGSNQHIFEMVYEVGKYLNCEYICKDKIIKNGVRGQIVYKNHDDYADVSAMISITDPEYDSMKRELADLRNEVAELREANRRLQNEIDYRPGGNGYEGAKSHFEDIRKDI